MTEPTPELAQAIAEHVRNGKSFRAIEKLEGMPTRKTIRRWEREFPDFARMIETAEDTKERLALATAEISPQRERQCGGLIRESIDWDRNGNVLQERARVKIACTLDWYKERRIITPEMWQAGNRFALLHFTAGKLPRTTPMYGDFVNGRRGAEGQTTKTDAQVKLEAALKVLTPAEQDVIWDVCGSDLHAGTPGRVRSMQTGLRALSVHFALPIP